MARLPALVDAIAENDWRPKSLIQHFGKTVREARLILSDKPGIAAADMTYADAATLLMAVGGSHNPAGAEQAVNNLRALDRRAWEEIDRMKREDMPAELAFLRPDMAFTDVLETMIQKADDLVAWEQDYLAGWDPDEKGSAELRSMEGMVTKAAQGLNPIVPGYAKAVRVVFYQPGLAAEVHLGRSWKRIDEDDAFHEFYVAPAERFDDRVPKDNVGTIEVGTSTLLALKKAVEKPTRVIKRGNRSPEYR